MCGFSRRSLANWRAGLEPYPKTTRGLFEIHSFVAGLIDRLTLKGTRLWLAEPLPGADASIGSRRDLLLQGLDALPFLFRQADTLLFEKVPRVELVAEFEDTDTSDSKIAPKRDYFTDPPSRRRSKP
jgi:hypothetical protein